MFEKFPIMAWPVGEFNESNIEEVKLWKEIGLTFNISAPWNETKHKKDAFIKLLDECYRNDIKIFVQDTRLHWAGAAADPDSYREKFRAAYRDFGKHPATLGFMIGDEPRKAEMDDVLAAFQIQTEEAPELLPFLNLLPIWMHPNSRWFETIEDYITFMKKEYNAPILSYDRYTQMNGTDDGVHAYFRDMRINNDIAQSLGIPLWTCLLTLGHWDYSAPDEAAVRWQLNTALASGCTGIIWFTLNDIPFQLNSHGAAINAFGEKTKYFDNIKSVAKHFLASTADIFKDLTLDRCYHIGHAYGGYPLYKEGDSDIVLSVESLKGTDMILSFFTHKSGDKYVAVVNNSKTVNNNNFNITFNANTCDPYEIRGFGESVRVYSAYPNQGYNNFIPQRGANSKTDTAKHYTINLWAAAGQMYLFKIN